MSPRANELRFSELPQAAQTRLAEAIAGRRPPRPIASILAKGNERWPALLIGGLAAVALLLLVTGGEPLGWTALALLAIPGVAIGWGAAGWGRARQAAKAPLPAGRFLFVTDLLDTRDRRYLLYDLTGLTEAKVRTPAAAQGKLEAELHLSLAEGALSLPLESERIAVRAYDALKAARQQYREAYAADNWSAVTAMDPLYEVRYGGSWDSFCRPLSPQESRSAGSRGERQPWLGLEPATLGAGALAGLVLAVVAWFGVNFARDEMAFARAKSANTVKGWNTYLQRDGARHLVEVHQMLRPAAALAAARREGTASALHEFLEKYGASPSAIQARARLKEVYDQARRRAAEEAAPGAREALTGLLDWLEANHSPVLDVRFGDSYRTALAGFDSELQEILPRFGLRSNTFEAIAPTLGEAISRQREDALMGFVADGFRHFAPPDVVSLRRGGTFGGPPGGFERPALAIVWGVSPRLLPNTTPVMDTNLGRIYWPLIVNFEAHLIVPQRPPFVVKFEFDPARHIPAGHTENSLYDRMIEMGFDEANQRLARAFFAKHVPERRIALAAPSKSAPAAVARPPRVSGPIASATGFCISPLGYVVTAQHFTAGVKKYKVQSLGRLFDAELVREDEANDIAVLKVKEPLRGALPIRLSKTVRLGESVATLGYPRTDVQGEEPKLGRGEISSLSGLRDDPRQFQISVPIQPGNSGGPLVDLSGQVVGVVVAQLRSGQSVNYAVKSSLLLSLLENIPELASLTPLPAPAAPPPFEDMIDGLRKAVVLIKGYDAE